MLSSGGPQGSCSLAAPGDVLHVFQVSVTARSPGFGIGGQSYITAAPQQSQSLDESGSNEVMSKSRGTLNLFLFSSLFHIDAIVSVLIFSYMTGDAT